MRSLRVTGGELGGRRIRIAASVAVRPTADRVREGLFAWLSDVEGERVLDLYAGTGALGIEALSRGAASAVWVERSERLCVSLRRSVAELDLRERGRIVRGDAPKVLARLGRAGERFDLVFLDPPYASEEVGRALAALVDSGVLAPGARVVAETPRHRTLPEARGLVSIEARRYGDAQITRLGAALAERRETQPPDEHEKTR